MSLKYLKNEIKNLNTIHYNQSHLMLLDKHAYYTLDFLLIYSRKDYRVQCQDFNAIYRMRYILLNIDLPFNKAFNIISIYHSVCMCSSECIVVKKVKIKKLKNSKYKIYLN